MRATILCAALALASAGAASAQEFTSSNEAFEAARAGQVVEGRVSKAIAAEAARELEDAPLGDLAYHLLVARAGGADRAAARSLMERYADDPAPDRLVCARLVLSLDPREAFEAVADVPSWLEVLEEKVAGEGQRGPLLRLLAWHGGPDAVLDLIEEWNEGETPSPQLRLFLSELRGTQRPKEVFDAVMQLDEEELTPAHGILYRSLIKTLARREGMPDHIIGRVRGGLSQPLVYVALGYLEPKAKRRVRRYLLERLGQETGRALAYAVEAAVSLKLTEAVPRLFEVAEREDGVAAAAALRGISPLIGRTRGKEKAELEARLAQVAEDALGGEGELLSAGIDVCFRIRLEGALDKGQLMAWAKDGQEHPRVRGSALGVLAFTLEKTDFAAIEELMALLADDEPLVRNGAHGALKQVSGTSFPPRLPPWRSWLNRARIQAGEAPLEDDEGVE